MTEPVSLTFIFQTIGVILVVTAIGVVLVKKNKRSKASK